MGLFEHIPDGQELHSGGSSQFRINCDWLKHSEWETFAWIVANKWPGFHFGLVMGIPMGGCKFAKELEHYTTPLSDKILIVDDVLTTGKSMNDYRDWFMKNHNLETEKFLGVVAFDRTDGIGECPDWVTPVFSMPKRKKFTISPGISVTTVD